MPILRLSVEASNFLSVWHEDAPKFPDWINDASSRLELRGRVKIYFLRRQSGGLLWVVLHATRSAYCSPSALIPQHGELCKRYFHHPKESWEKYVTRLLTVVLIVLENWWTGEVKSSVQSTQHQARHCMSRLSVVEILRVLNEMSFLRRVGASFHLGTARWSRSCRDLVTPILIRSCVFETGKDLLVSAIIACKMFFETGCSLPSLFSLDRLYSMKVRRKWDVPDRP